MKKLLIAVIIIVILIVVVVALKKEPVPASPESPLTDQPDATSAPVVILITDDGFTPAEVTIPAGVTITFANEGAQPHWPASAMHPTHTVYPGSDIEKCGTAEAATIFDACRGLENGESWTFTFGEVGEWRYHDHLAPTQFGKVIVTP